MNKELKIKGMIVNITDSNKNYKLYDLSPIDENSIEDDSLLSTSIDTTGSNENIGIIAAIKKTSKNPIALSIKSNLNTKLQVAFSDIPLDKVSTHGEIDYHIGHKVSFYCDKEYKCTFVPSSEVKPVTIEIGKVYICRILKAIDGKGFIVDINAGKEIETFVDICEIADEAVANPLKTFEIGSIAKCRIISLNSKANRYMASLRSSIVNDDSLLVSNCDEHLKNIYDKISCFLLALNDSCFKFKFLLSNSISPFVGIMNPAIIFRNTLLPLPFLP